jgi:hypothetical protein
MMTGFGYKTAWLAFHGQDQQQIAARLGLAGTRHEDWEPAIEASYDPRRQAVAITPALPGHGGVWALATGLILGLEMDLVAPKCTG